MLRVALVRRLKAAANHVRAMSMHPDAQFVAACDIEPLMAEQPAARFNVRERFRPFAPGVLRDLVGDCFEMDFDRPYMLLVTPDKQERQLPMIAEQRTLSGLDLLDQPRSDIPAVTHIEEMAKARYRGGAVGVYGGPEEVVAAADSHRACRGRDIDGSCSGTCAGSVHLHDLLAPRPDKAMRGSEAL